MVSAAIWIIASVAIIVILALQISDNLST